MKLAFLFLIIISTTFTACKSNKQSKVVNNPSEKIIRAETNSITGQWQWLQTSCCGRVPKITTPKTENLNVLLILKVDNTFEKLENTTLKENGKYEINKTIDGDKREMIKLSTIPRSGYLYIQNDTLIIDYGYIDLQTEYYIRKK
jgi:hypothetical protein